jgi:hypothetical protein
MALRCCWEHRPNLDLDNLRTISPLSQLVEPDISQDSEEPAFMLLPARNLPIPCIARTQVSCTKSSASAGLRVKTGA